MWYFNKINKTQLCHSSTCYLNTEPQCEWEGDEDQEVGEADQDVLTATVASWMGAIIPMGCNVCVIIILVARCFNTLYMSF